MIEKMTQETRTRLDRRGQIAIPASVLKALNINIGDEVIMRLEDGELVITSIKPRVGREGDSE